MSFSDHVKLFTNITCNLGLGQCVIGTEFIVTIKLFIILFSRITSVSAINKFSMESDLFQFLTRFTIR